MVRAPIRTFQVPPARLRERDGVGPGGGAAAGGAGRSRAAGLTARRRRASRRRRGSRNRWRLHHDLSVGSRFEMTNNSLCGSGPPCPHQGCKLLASCRAGAFLPAAGAPSCFVVEVNWPAAARAMNAWAPLLPIIIEAIAPCFSAPHPSGTRTVPNGCSDGKAFYSAASQVGPGDRVP